MSVLGYESLAVPSNTRISGAPLPERAMVYEAAGVAAIVCDRRRLQHGAGRYLPSAGSRHLAGVALLGYSLSATAPATPPPARGAASTRSAAEISVSTVVFVHHAKAVSTVDVHIFATQ